MKFVLYLLLLSSLSSQAQTDKVTTNVQTGHKHASKGYVLQKGEGEVLLDPRGRKMIIKVSPERGAAHLTMGTTEMPQGTGIFIHRHEHAEELATYYPSIQQNHFTEIPFALFKAFCLTNENKIKNIISTRIVQTNVINRCAYLMPIFSKIISEEDKPTTIVDRNKCRADTQL